MSEKPTYKILIVDDNCEDRTIIGRYLYQDDRYNYQILEAELVSEALEICDSLYNPMTRNRTPLDLILLDYFLPDDDGLVFLQEWQRRYGNTLAPVVLLTGQGNDKIAVEVMKNGAQDYCVKGELSAAGLRQTVHTVLQKLELKRQIACQQEQQTLINSIALRIRQSLRPEEVLQTTVVEVRQFLHTDRVLIYKFAPDMSGTIVAEAVLPDYIPCLDRQIDDPCFKESYVEKYRQGRVFTASDIQTAGLTDCHRNLLESFQTKANLVVPILLKSTQKNQNDLWGLLIAHQCDRPRQWQNYEVDLLQQLAVQLAIAIQQAEMYERVQAELYERVQAELRERQRVATEFRALVENATDIIYRMDRQMRYLYFNPAIEQLLQQPASSLIGKTAQDLGVCAEIIALWRSTLDRMIATKVQETLEHPFPNLDSPVWFQIRIAPELDETGEVDSFLCIARDISDRKRNEKTLQFQAQILEQIRDAVIVTGVDGKISSWNQGAEKLYGYTAAEAIGQNVFMLYLPEDLPLVRSLVFEPLLAKETHEAELRNRTKSGEIIYISLRLSLIRDKEGDIINLIGCSNDISDRKKIEQELQQLNQELEARVEQRTAELQESQRFIQSITDNTPNIIYIYDLLEKRNIYANKEVLAILGYTPEQIQMMGTSFLTELTHPDDLEEFVAHLSGLENLNDGEKRSCEYRMRDTNGQWHWFVSRHAVFLRGKDGKVKQIVGTAQEISERKQMEEQLRKSETHLKAAQRIAGLGSWEFDLQNQEIIWSSEIFTIFDRNPENGTPTLEELQQIIHPEDCDLHNQVIQQAIEQWQSYEIEFRLYRPDGTLRYLQARGEPIFNSEGQVVRLVGTAIDITERKKAEEQLRNLSDRLTLAVKSGRFGIWEWDILRNTLIWDDRMYELYGLQKSDSPEPYQTWAKGLHPDDREPTETALQKAVRGENEYDPEFRIVHPNGSIRDIKAYALVQRNERGEPQQMVGVNFDITSSKQAEQELRLVNERLTLTNAELDRATRLKDEFLANMSHELRTPLNAILGMSETLLDGVFGNLNDRQKHAVNNIDRSGHHLLTLINDILDLAKVESGKLELELAPTSISYLCGNSLIFVRQQAIKKNIQIITDIPSELPEIAIDELRIRQVLINLLSNAVKFTPDGGTVKLMVESVQKSNQNWLQFSVIDTGIGMTQEDTGKLFKPFVQIDSRLNRQYSGTGLGLALVRRLVELHQGTVGVKSELGQGSCFTVCLPYIMSEATTVQASISQAKSINDKESTIVSPGSQTGASTSTILLVEDNELNIATISSYLGSKGYRLLVAKNGEDAIKFAKSLCPDLILMDIQLPKVDGLEAIRQIRAEEHLANTPIIALTALAMPGDQERCLVAGANAYMSKPVKLKQLVENIQSLLTKA
ncbi:PAS domain-containing protein [Aerosakkonemataceae cyanobacterium BLCC-F50]|uniref:histidine kinase n=1 Tax=Floridaenema flaviceps BLCC-F50 TaxID=3153642 RepID=A0ABV4Y0G5_9CYAN